MSKADARYRHDWSLRARGGGGTSGICLNGQPLTYDDLLWHLRAYDEQCESGEDLRQQVAQLTAERDALFGELVVDKACAENAIRIARGRPKVPSQEALSDARAEVESILRGLRKPNPPAAAGGKEQAIPAPSQPAPESSAVCVTCSGKGIVHVSYCGCSRCVGSPEHTEIAVVDDCPDCHGTGRTPASGGTG